MGHHICISIYPTHRNRRELHGESSSICNKSLNFPRGNNKEIIKCINAKLGITLDNNVIQMNSPSTYTKKPIFLPNFQQISNQKSTSTRILMWFCFEFRNSKSGIILLKICPCIAWIIQAHCKTKQNKLLTTSQSSPRFYCWEGSERSPRITFQK